ncbi:LPP20 family lipoprotein [Shewanella sp. 10N.286.45.A1]|uniref:LPP20 family lipoprotein n=1 Tax=Shewanella sp. 10N.286.45.A1 TaxID=3229694 RepID=UPI00354D96BC
MNLKLSAIFLGLTLVVACQSTSKAPDWYLNPTLTNSASLVAVGEATSLDKAKQKAMSALNQQLWTEVKSKGLSRNIANDINGREHYQQLNDFSVNTKTSAVVLNGVVFSKAQQVGKVFYVEAVVDKSNIEAQLLADIENYNQQVQFELDSLSQMDSLVWWLKNADVTTLERNMASRLSMLTALSSEKQTSRNLIPQLKAKVAEVHSGIKVAIAATVNDQLMKKSITAYFTDFNIQVVDAASSSYSHKLILDTDWRKNYISDMYISTVQVNLVLKNHAGNVLASNEVIANANSVTSYERANEGATRKFSAELKEQSFWKALGL